MQYFVILQYIVSAIVSWYFRQYIDTFKSCIIPSLASTGKVTNCEKHAVTRYFLNRNKYHKYILVKGFGTQIVKLVLEYSLRSHDPAHMICWSSRNDTMKDVEFV